MEDKTDRRRTIQLPERKSGLRKLNRTAANKSDILISAVNGESRNCKTLKIRGQLGRTFALKECIFIGRRREER